MRTVFIWMALSVVAHGQTFEQWEQSVASTVAELESLSLGPPSAGNQYTDSALIKVSDVQDAVAALRSASDQVVDPAEEPIPPPAVQVHSAKPYRDGGNDPFIINVVDHDNSGGKWGELFIALNKAEPQEVNGENPFVPGQILGIDPAEHPGIQEVGQWYRSDYAGLLIFTWPMDSVEVSGPITFRIQRRGGDGVSQGFSGLEGAAICRVTSGGLLAENYSADAYSSKIHVPTITPLATHLQYVFVTGQADVDVSDIPIGIDITGENWVTRPTQWHGPEDVVHLVIAEKEVEAPEPGFSIDVRRQQSGNFFNDSKGNVVVVLDRAN